MNKEDNAIHNPKCNNRNLKTAVLPMYSSFRQNAFNTKNIFNNQEKIMTMHDDHPSRHNPLLQEVRTPRSCSTSPCNVLRKSPSSCDNRRNKLHNSSPNPWNCSFDIWTNAYIAAGNQTLRTIATKHCGKCQTWNRSPQRTITQMNQINQPTTNQSVKYLKFALFEIK